jgi:hypothetical protein
MSRTIRPLSPEQQAATEAARLAANGAEAQAKLAEAEAAKYTYGGSSFMTQGVANSAESGFRPPATPAPYENMPEHVVTGLE